MSSIKRIIPRLNSMAFKMKFPELVQEIKPVSIANLYKKFNLPNKVTLSLSHTTAGVQVSCFKK